MNWRLGKREAGAEVAKPTPIAVSVAPAPPMAQPQAETRTKNPLAGAQLADVYRNALMLFGRGKMEDARKTFQQVFDQDPAGDLADNALFWIGETYYTAGNY